MFKNKVSTKPSNFSTEQIFKYFVDELILKHPYWIIRRKGHLAEGEVITENGEVYIDYKQFKNILAATNKAFGEKLIKGCTVNLLNGLGDVYIARIERNPNNLKVNYHESNRLKKKLQEEGVELTNTNWKVYYTDEEYIKLKHHKPTVLRNIQFYHFKPAGGPTGFRRKFAREIMTNAGLKALYPLIKRT